MLFVGACGGAEHREDAGSGGWDAAPNDAVLVDVIAWDDGASDVEAGDALFDASGTEAAPRTCGPAPCDPAAAPGARDGCDAMQRCVLTPLGPRCVTGSGTVAEGEPCTSSLDCLEGLACFAMPIGARCGRPCCPASPDACGEDRDGGSRPRTSCTAAALLVEGAAERWGWCALPRSCHVLDPMSCGVGEGCYIVSPMGDAECRIAGRAGVGDRCTEPHDCAPGLFCGGIAEKRCIRMCALGDAGGPRCGPGETCTAFAHTPRGTGLCIQEQARPP
ncbi:MAG: hypothetical protein NZ898_07325 [Myxococcota bacterium]|nr:hypothetical protein [Myxococcota bacterium]